MSEFLQIDVRWPDGRRQRWELAADDAAKLEAAVVTDGTLADWFTARVQAATGARTLMLVSDLPATGGIDNNS
jgi:hypothetical protein